MCFGKAFHLILMHFYFLFSMLWGMFTKIRLFFKKDVFPDFRLVQSIFRSIEIFFKNFGEPLYLVRLIETVFRSIEHRESSFLKHGSWLFQKSFFKSFSSFLSLSLRFRLGSTSDFCRFWSFLLQDFSLQTPVRPFYPSFCFYFLISCIFNLEISNYA